MVKQVLSGQQGCGGILGKWMERWIERKWNLQSSKHNHLIVRNIEQLWQKAIFIAEPKQFKELISDSSKGNERNFIEDLAVSHLSSAYSDKVLEIHREKPPDRSQKTQISVYDARMSGRLCLLKVHQHCTEEVMKPHLLKAVLFRKEIEILQVLSSVPCAYIVQQFASSTEVPMHLIIEKSHTGDLLTWLRNPVNDNHSKNADQTKTEHLLQIALDICSAMIFLGEQNVIHRDLRAKNCFVFIRNGKHVIKLGNFQLAVLMCSGRISPPSINCQRITSDSSSSSLEAFREQFSVRWTAVEALEFDEFSAASDVWSYGVLLSEVFTFGSEPYVNMPSGLSLSTDKEVREFVSLSHRNNLTQYTRHA